jgi:threonine dehydrogenase-like Zn-dependent dehydrogenase
MDYGAIAGEVDAVDIVLKCTSGLGADATIITAATQSDLPVQQAMEMTRRKGKVVVVGDVGLHLKRQPFYEKEIDFLISCSYGPGRYDETYEEEGIDYPYAYVRWTENRNMQEY